MSHSETPTTILVPGLRGETPDHWQERMADEVPGVLHIPTPGRQHHDLDERTEALQRAVESVRGPVTIVAHSAGVITTVHWAHRYGTVVDGALLCTPPDLAQPLPGEYPSLGQLAAAGWLPVPGNRLPFPSVVAASRNDSLGDFRNVSAMASTWGSHLVDLGPVGHLNPVSGHGDWRWVECLLHALSSVVEADRAARVQR